MKPELRRLLVPKLAATALIAATACSVTGWAYTAHELNTLVAYRPVGLEALRALKTDDDAAGPARVAWNRERPGADERHLAPRITPAGYRAP